LPFASIQDDPTIVEPVTLPPPIRSREKVHRLALFFSALNEPERDAVASSGKVGRYAVYLSAYYRLQRLYPGARLRAYLSHPSVDPSTSNLWPYLLARQLEADSRLAAVQASWLGRLWPSARLRHSASDLAFDAIRPELYASPEDPRQLSVALRAILARLHTSLAMVRGLEEIQEGALGRIVGAKAVAEGLWRLDVVRQVARPDGCDSLIDWETALVLEAVRQNRQRPASYLLSRPLSPLPFADRRASRPRAFLDGPLRDSPGRYRPAGKPAG